MTGKIIAVISMAEHWHEIEVFETQLQHLEIAKYMNIKVLVRLVE